MAQSGDLGKYDELLTSILVNEKSIIGFMSTIFNFLARRTDFYYNPQDPSENMGFPPGVAEELVVKVLRACDPKNWKPPNGASKPHDITNEIMCSTVAQEVEVVTENDEIVDQSGGSIHTEEIVDQLEGSISIERLNIDEHAYSLPTTSVQPAVDTAPVTKETSSEEAAYPEPRPPLLPTQQNSDTYNGADCGTYCWAQTITDIDIIVHLPSSVKSSKQVSVCIEAERISVRRVDGDGETLLDGSLQYRVQAVECCWSIEGGKLLIHLEKAVERWWTKLLVSEEAIDLQRIDCSRPLYDLPDDHIAKIHEIQFNQQQKMLGRPTSEQLRHGDTLRRAWDAPGSPFAGQPFDPNVLSE